MGLVLMLGSVRKTNTTEAMYEQKMQKEIVKKARSLREFLGLARKYIS